MNFNLNNQRTKLQISTPIMRQFSTIRLMSIKPDQNDYGVKADLTFAPNNFLHNFGASIISNKSFSNPNFVNKRNPHVLSASNFNSTNFKFDKQKILESVTPSLFIPQSKHNTMVEDNYKLTISNNDLSSSQSKTQTISVNEKTDKQMDTDPIKISSKKARNRRNRRNAKLKKNSNVLPDVESSSCKKSNMSKKNCKSVCFLPKQFKIDNDVKKSRGGGSGKTESKFKKFNKQLRDIAMDLEMMNCDDISLPTPDTPQIQINPYQHAVIKKKSSPIEITIPRQNANKLTSESVSYSLSLSTSNTSSSDVSSLCSSPAIRRLRMPSECDSEDSFIVFCDDSNNSCISDGDDCDDDDDNDDDDDDDEVDDDGDTSSVVNSWIAESESDIDVGDYDKTDFSEITKKKKVTFEVDSKLCKIHPMVQWSYAYHTARIGPWEVLARDRVRFEQRIKNTESQISSIFDPKHRDKIYHERFEHLN